MIEKTRNHNGAKMNKELCGIIESIYENANDIHL